MDGELAEAEVRSALARDLGTARDAILAETGALTTRQEAVRVKALLAPKGVRRILLVTDSHHLARARSVFEGAGFEVLPAPADDTPNSADQPESRLKLMRRVAEELLGRPMEGPFLLALVGFTSLGAVLAGAKGLGHSPGALRHAAGRMLETIGLALVFFLGNLAGPHLS